MSSDTVTLSLALVNRIHTWFIRQPYYLVEHLVPQILKLREGVERAELQLFVDYMHEHGIHRDVDGLINGIIAELRQKQ